MWWTKTQKKNRFDEPKDYNHPRKNKDSGNVKSILVPDYKIEYDKNLRPQAIREKSIERKIAIKKEQSKVEVKPVPKFSYDSDNNPMSETEGGLSSYAPSEKTKNFFVNQFKQNTMDQSSVLSNSLNYSDEEQNRKYRNDKPAFNNYMSQK